MNKDMNTNYDTTKDYILAKNSTRDNSSLNCILNSNTLFESNSTTFKENDDQQSDMLDFEDLISCSQKRKSKQKHFAVPAGERDFDELFETEGTSKRYLGNCRDDENIDNKFSKGEIDAFFEEEPLEHHISENRSVFNEGDSDDGIEYHSRITNFEIRVRAPASKGENNINAEGSRNSSADSDIDDGIENNGSDSTHNESSGNANNDNNQALVK